MDELVDGLHGAYVHNGLRDWFDSGSESALEGPRGFTKRQTPCWTWMHCGQTTTS